jgi:hypothetical protein
MGVRPLAWYESVETVRPVGKGVLMLSGVSAAAFLYTANCMRLSTPLVQIKVVWSQFAVTTATATVGLALLLKPCWKDPLYCRTQSDLAKQDLGKLGWQEYYAKWSPHFGHLGEVPLQAKAWLTVEIATKDFFEFVRRHGVDNLGDQADTLKRKYDPTTATYADVMGARADLEKLGIEVDPWLASQFGGLEDIEALATQFPTALADGALSRHRARVAELLQKQVEKDGWSSCMKRYQGYHDLLLVDGRRRVVIPLGTDMGSMSVAAYWTKHGNAQFLPDRLKQKLLQEVKTAPWDETASLKPLAEALKLPWSEVVAQLDYAPPAEVKAALDAGHLAQADFQAWVLRVTESIDDLLEGFEWAAPYLQQGEEMDPRVYDHYWVNRESDLHNGDWTHLVPEALKCVLRLNEPEALESFLQQHRTSDSMMRSFIEVSKQ